MWGLSVCVELARYVNQDAPSHLGTSFLMWPSKLQHPCDSLSTCVADSEVSRYAIRDENDRVAVPGKEMEEKGGKKRKAAQAAH